MAVQFPQYDNELLGGSDTWDEGFAGHILLGDYFVEAAGGIALTPGVASLTITTYAPTPSVSASVTLTLGSVALSVNAYAPSITVSEHRRLTVGVASVAFTTLTPSVLMTNNRLIAPGIVMMTLGTYTPTVSIQAILVPGAQAVLLTPAPPVVIATNNYLMTPAVASMVLTMFAVDVAVRNDVRTDVPPTELALATFTPTVVATRMIVPHSQTMLRTERRHTPLGTESTTSVRSRGEYTTVLNSEPKTVILRTRK